MCCQKCSPIPYYPSPNYVAPKPKTFYERYRAGEVSREDYYAAVDRAEAYRAKRMRDFAEGRP